MKILVLLFLVFASTLGVTEVRAARGVVPSIAPLFPTPENTKANLGRNVNYEGESVFSEPTAAELAEGEAPESPATSTKTAGVAATTTQQSQTYWWWIIGVLVAVGVVGASGYWWFRMQKRV